MREIKFRITYQHEETGRFTSRIIKVGDTITIEILGLRWIIVGKDQFIGLTDKHGKDIYEGDIVEYLDNTSQGLIKKTVVIEDIRYLPDFTCSKWEEIIGNIYEHPDLLEKQA